MYKTEREIFSQYQALKKTYEYFLNNAERIRKIKDEHEFSSLTFIGCGSSYCICQSAEISAKIHLGMPTNSIPAGDLMLNFSHYAGLMQHTLLVAPSRSGSTSEVIFAIKKVREKYRTCCIGICAREGSELSGIVDLSLEIPWAFDESVCQTRTVTNLYTANLILIGILSGDRLLIEEIKKAIDSGDTYMKENAPVLKDIAEDNPWEKVVVLADSELCGIAGEGALAFKEISRIQSNYYHLLDVRHGPMVLIDKKTLVIMACSPYEISYQQDLVRDLKQKGAKVVTVSSQKENIWGSDCNITIPDYKNYAVAGIPFIFVPQVIGYFRAVKSGVNPDVPEGLDPWIEL